MPKMPKTEFEYFIEQKAKEKAKFDELRDA